MKRKKRSSVMRTPKSQTKSKRRFKKIPISLKIISAVIILFIMIITVFKITDFLQRGSQKLPKLEIFLTDVTTEQIITNSKDEKYENNAIALTTNNKTTHYKDIEIKGHGNLTWIQPKKPYQLKFSKSTDLYEYGKAKKWLLLANYLDGSHLRNKFAFFIQRILNTDNPVDSQFLELYIDNLYQGLYLLSEKVEINKNRINLKNPSGIIIELDNLHNTDESCALYSKNKDCLIVHDIVNPDNTTEATNNFVKKFDQLEAATTGKDYDTVSKLIDIDSFAKYFLINEFSNNPDAYGSSFFLYTDGEDDLIHASSGWDFDMAFGNKQWPADESIDTETFLSPTNTTIFKDRLSNSRSLSGSHLDRISTLLYDLMDIPEFEARVKEIYQSTLSGKKDELLDYIKSQADYIRSAAIRDQERWKLTTNFDEEIDYLIDWIAKRYDHFEETYGANSNTVEDTTTPNTTDLLPNDEPNNNYSTDKTQD